MLHGSVGSSVADGAIEQRSSYSTVLGKSSLDGPGEAELDIGMRGVGQCSLYLITIANTQETASGNGMRSLSVDPDKCGLKHDQ